MTSTEKITIGRNPTLTLYVMEGLRKRKLKDDKRKSRKAKIVSILNNLGIKSNGLSI